MGCGTSVFLVADEPGECLAGGNSPTRKPRARLYYSAALQNSANSSASPSGLRVMVEPAQVRKTI